jgi:hypothetical protein
MGFSLFGGNKEKLYVEGEQKTPDEILTAQHVLGALKAKGWSLISTIKSGSDTTYGNISHKTEIDPKTVTFRLFRKHEKDPAVVFVGIDTSIGKDFLHPDSSFVETGNGTISINNAQRLLIIKEGLVTTDSNKTRIHTCNTDGSVPEQQAEFVPKGLIIVAVKAVLENTTLDNPADNQVSVVNVVGF